MPTKIFISYSHDSEAHRTAVLKLSGQLRENGQDCLIDQNINGSPAEGWTRWMENEIERADFVLIVCTPTYLQRYRGKSIASGRGVNFEGVVISQTLYENLGCNDKFLPIIFDSVDRENIPLPLKSYTFYTLPEDYESLYRVLTQQPVAPLKPLGSERVLSTITTGKLPANRSKLPPVVSLPQCHRMPYRSLGSNFAGRINDLWKLHDLLIQSDTAVVEGVGVVMGTGGLGKTQLATEYVHRFANDYPGGIFWTNADQGFSVVINQIAQAANITLDDRLPMKQQREKLWNTLSQSQACILIVYDNFSETDVLTPWLPVGAYLKTLITTRRRDLNRYPKLSLNYLNDTEGLQLLNSGDRHFGKEAIALVNRLGGLPLALELACNFLNLRPTLSIDQLLQRIEETGELQALQVFEKNYADELPTGHIKEVVATFQLSWDLATPHAQQILKLMSLWAPTAVPRRLLRRAFDVENSGGLNDKVDEAISNLSSLSLVDLDDHFDPQMHRLLACFVATKLSGDDEIEQIAVETIENELSRVDDEYDLAAYTELEKVIPHGVRLLENTKTDPQYLVNISDFIRRHYYKCGRYRLAETFGNRALHIAENNFEVGHPTIATNQSNLGLVLQDLGELDAARDLFQKALASDENSFEAGHPNIATSQSTLAMVLRDLGELDGALDLLQKSLVSDENSFEAGHPNIARSQSNLGLVLRGLGELDGARDLLQKALVSAENSFEAGHPIIARSQSNLAIVHQDLGELDGARDLLQKAFVSASNSFGAGHPNIAICQSNLALVLQDLGELNDARDLLQKALMSDENNFEAGHPSIALSQSNLATVLRDLGELDGAHNLLCSAYRSCCEKLGDDHPLSKTIKENLEFVEAETDER